MPALSGVFDDGTGFLVVVANPHDDLDASVDLQHREDGAWVTDETVLLAPREALFRETMEHALTDSGVYERKALRAVADVPVIAQQLSASVASESATDASTLLQRGKAPGPPPSSW